ncbi:hypothetical protein CAEBREN_16052 [Caenorhabditis brenneri]|uniref:Uncharacterized protein n=1 Tax=Caenorhabditis brenneri TaxID=135651 RepID=G0MHI6_CAEBE|nr:hypothetical protein CAEBREN_16052 [Caenorhabditis brenneri]
MATYSPSSSPIMYDPELDERVLDIIDDIFSTEKQDSSLEKLKKVVNTLESVIAPQRLENLRKTASDPLNVVKVCLQLSKKAMKTVEGQDRLATRLQELIRMDGQYVTKRETIDSVIQLLEIHHLFDKGESEPQKKRVHFE